MDGLQRMLWGQSRFPQSPRREESRIIVSSVVSRRLSPRREESRVIASSVVSLCVVQLLGVSRVVCGVVSVSGILGCQEFASNTMLACPA